MHRKLIGICRMALNEWACSNYLIMRAQLEKLEKSKNPFLQAYAHSNLNEVNNLEAEDPCKLLISTIEQNEELKKVDKLYQLNSELNTKFRNRFRSKQEFKYFLKVCRSQPK